MNESRLVSILLPFYNEEKYIIECIQSIQDQEYTNWELIAIDDHSTDRSPEMVHELMKTDSRIRYLKNQEKGVISALQNGFDLCSGELITRMDADDRKTPDNLALMAEILEAQGLIATGLVRYFSDEPQGVQGGYARYEEWINDVIEKEACFTQVYKECTIPSPCWLIHREDLVRAGVFRSDLYPEDYDLNLRFHKVGLDVRTVKKVIHYWRDHGNRVTRNDARYADNFFIDLKLPYFLDIEHSENTELVLWGAGRKAKEIAKRLVERELSFRWISNNERKTGLDIYGVRLEEQRGFPFQSNQKIMIAVSSPTDQEEINKLLETKELKEGVNYWWFC